MQLRMFAASAVGETDFAAGASEALRGAVGDRNVRYARNIAQTIDRHVVEA